mmetsp:Transcript_17071/g.46817  ORF Transcript_17071/g.46817 Transcript_17071/m.46817 type:complete len:343 (+) Transcript_17071:1206-2234(+)
MKKRYILPPKSNTLYENTAITSLHLDSKLLVLVGQSLLQHRSDLGPFLGVDRILSHGWGEHARLVVSSTLYRLGHGQICGTTGRLRGGLGQESKHVAGQDANGQRLDVPHFGTRTGTRVGAHGFVTAFRQHGRVGGQEPLAFAIVLVVSTKGFFGGWDGVKVNWFGSIGVRHGRHVHEPPLFLLHHGKNHLGENDLRQKVGLEGRLPSIFRSRKGCAGDNSSVVDETINAIRVLFGQGSDESFNAVIVGQIQLDRVEVLSKFFGIFTGHSLLDLFLGGINLGRGTTRQDDGGFGRGQGVSDFEAQQARCSSDHVDFGRQVQAFDSFQTRGAVFVPVIKGDEG